MYHVVENAGQTNEKTVQQFQNWVAANLFVNEEYTFRDMRKRRVDIMLEDADGNLTTDY